MRASCSRSSRESDPASANRLGVTELSPPRSASVQASLPSNPAAARLYAEGLAKLRLYDAQAARILLEQAVSADPKLPLATLPSPLAWSALGYDERAQAIRQTGVRVVCQSCSRGSHVG